MTRFFSRAAMMLPILALSAFAACHNSSSGSSGTPPGGTNQPPAGSEVEIDPSIGSIPFPEATNGTMPVIFQDSFLVLRLFDGTRNVPDADVTIRRIEPGTSPIETSYVANEGDGTQVAIRPHFEHLRTAPMFSPFADLGESELWELEMSPPDADWSLTMNFIVETTNREVQFSDKSFRVVNGQIIADPSNKTVPATVAFGHIWNLETGMKQDGGGTVHWYRAADSGELFSDLIGRTARPVIDDFPSQVVSYLGATVIDPVSGDFPVLQEPNHNLIAVAKLSDGTICAPRLVRLGDGCRPLLDFAANGGHPNESNLTVFIDNDAQDHVEFQLLDQLLGFNVVTPPQGMHPILEIWNMYNSSEWYQFDVTVDQNGGGHFTWDGGNGLPTLAPGQARVYGARFVYDVVGPPGSGCEWQSNVLGQPIFFDLLGRP